MKFQVNAINFSKVMTLFIWGGMIHPPGLDKIEGIDGVE